MSFHIRHRYGGNDVNPSLSALVPLLEELDELPSDAEHPSVSVVHESDWTVAAYLSGVVTLENVEELDIEPRHMVLHDREKTLQLMRSLAAGDLDAVFAAEWEPGYGPHP